MATRKKKTDDVWPKITKGTHLTVTTYENGRTELAWDDKALRREIRESQEAYELGLLKPAVRAKAGNRKKKEK
jgi:hypothetical protein